jgi:RimJ/RimL family protein N-acetyltransferase
MQQLNNSDFSRVAPIFTNITHSKPLVFSVIEGNNDGSIYVDNVENPKTALVILYDMLFLDGQENNSQFNTEIYDLLFNDIFPSMKEEYFDFYCMSNELRVKIEPIFGSKIHGRPIRKTFSFSKDDYSLHLNWRDKVPESYKMEFIAEDFIYKHGYDKEFWRPSTKRFGFSLVNGNEIISQCIAVFVGGGKAEIAVDTTEKYRNRGFATITCAAFIEYCLSIGLIPNWGCWDFRTASIALAKRLGFIETADEIVFGLKK